MRDTLSYPRMKPFNFGLASVVAVVGLASVLLVNGTITLTILGNKVFFGSPISASRHRRHYLGVTMSRFYVLALAAQPSPAQRSLLELQKPESRGELTTDIASQAASVEVVALELIPFDELQLACEEL